MLRPEFNSPLRRTVEKKKKKGLQRAMEETAVGASSASTDGEIVAVVHRAIILDFIIEVLEVGAVVRVH
jgi:hypothetical protein